MTQKKPNRGPQRSAKPMQVLTPWLQVTYERAHM
jgi:hypothetical protein